MISDPPATTDEAPPPTLGDILYSGRLVEPVAEADWAQLVAATAAGDAASFRALFERTHRLVFTVIARIVVSRETAEEVTLDVFVDVWRRAGSYDAASGSVLGWMLNQARSRAIDRVRLENRKKRVNSLPDEAAHDSAAVDADLRRRTDEQRRALTDALRLLSSDERHAIEAAYFGGYTHAESAERLGEPLGTVKTRIRSGLAKLKEALPEKGDLL